MSDETVTGHSWPAATVERIVAAWINNAKFMDDHEDVEGVGFQCALLAALAREAGAVEVEVFEGGRANYRGETIQEVWTGLMGVDPGKYMLVKVEAP